MIVWCGNLTILLSGLTFHCFWYRKQKTLCDSLHRPSRSDFVQLEFVIQRIDQNLAEFGNNLKSSFKSRTDLQTFYPMQYRESMPI